MPRKIVREPSTETGSEISKSPITKRAVIYGLIVGTLYVFLAIYTSLKTGVTFIAGSVLVGYILLSLRGKYNPQENVIITTIAEGSILVGVGVIASLPAIVIYSCSRRQQIVASIQ
ncbi:MAG: OPT/YSL family transporter [Candidatus Jordarchaeaceae archaeon]